MRFQEKSREIKLRCHSSECYHQDLKGDGAKTYARQ